jgi:putative transcriptional regulator
MRDDQFQELLESVREGGAILRGDKTAERVFVIEAPDVQEVRRSFGMTQAEFARMLGISIDTLQNWEQGRRHPVGPARVLLQVAAKHPEIVREAVMSLSPST